MGIFSVKARIWNVKEPVRSATVDLLVDTDSTYTMIPGRVLEDLGIKPTRSVRLRLADGRVIERPLGEAGIEVEGSQHRQRRLSLMMRATTYLVQ
ncbi:hypothetical protein VMUT_2282 [Vulcanisaeta moutnovskia 768-28]|uniref:Retroviral aspartyl protease n=1 Tax=Vulcanisaeta moutnovskia (strain 768-28) TaxID=985053 RepID=F0QXZ1_VULM7|nr:aspartyl protease family protein [Vulcanisaeta moutnovskia]ADY02477.1 hypothetical protein VMUT_2282 [Vulcanisaeta moutnovskia 768-28]